MTEHLHSYTATAVSVAEASAARWAPGQGADDPVLRRAARAAMAPTARVEIGFDVVSGEYELRLTD